MVCSWCGGAITGEPFSRASWSPLVWGDGSVEVELGPGREAVFCCGGCEWNYELDKHKLMGMPGKEARKHLVEEHELKPGRPAGYQSVECLKESELMAQAMGRAFVGELPGSLN